jgi:hypothetical protein
MITPEKRDIMKYITLFLFESQLEADHSGITSNTNKCSLAVSLRHDSPSFEIA